MNEKELTERLTAVFRDVFDDDSIVITPATTAEDIEEWDSVEHITLVGAVEEEFGLKFKMGEVSGMNNVGEMMRIIAARGR